MEAPRSARALEAAGAAEVTFDFRGTTVTIPLRIEAWPLDEIRAGRHGRALKALLGRQRPPMRTRADTVELSHRMADACGVTPLPEAPANPGGMFGAVPTLLHAVDNYGDDLEADLRRFYSVDYRDAAACTLRQVWVMIRRLPVESATMTARNGGKVPWTRGEIIAARSVEMWTRKPYPGRPPSPEELEEFLKKADNTTATMDHLADRESYYASGQNMRDAGVDTTGRRFRTPGHEQPPQRRQPLPSDPVERALAVAQRNARRLQGKPTNDHDRAGRNDDPGPGFRGGHWDTAGSGWGG